MAAKTTNYETQMSLDDVARALGISKPMALLIQNKAIAKFKRELNRRGIKFTDLMVE